MGGFDFRNKYSGKGRDGLLGSVLGEIGKRLGDKASSGSHGGTSHGGSSHGGSSRGGSGHGGGGNWGQRSGNDGAFGRDGRVASAKTAPRSRLPGFGSTAALVVLVVWTLLAWGGYSLVDGVLAWTSTNAGALVQTGRDAAAATGIGSEVVGVVGSAETSGLLGGFFALVGAVLKPLVVVVWLVGAVLIMAAPRLVSLLTRKFR
ncbi:hypothetical protein Amn_20060 [Aminobacter sp. Y103A]|uniref:hypothetical protein n=1 Tax=Aminobacter sp. Y103A TaxID=1870862 RepID=UPI0025729083|nr:hypothetical protein [Aminobacter sp. SS-2016]BBD37126.1 hypothetical protein Amn_20060 [Aminobacter sp. SS-2016]